MTLGTPRGLIFILSLATLIGLPAKRALASSLSPTDYVLESAAVEQSLTVESKTIDGRDVEVVTLPENGSFTISANFDSPDIVSSGLTPQDLAIAREQSREFLELTLRGLLSDDFNGNIIVDANGEAARVRAVTDGRTSTAPTFFQRLFAYNHKVYEPMPKGTQGLAYLKRWSAQAWQFAVVETIHASREYQRQFRNASPNFNEFGFAIDFKVEPQLFVANFNPTQKFRLTRRSWGLFFEISYSRKLHRVMIHNMIRKEKGIGGFGSPAVKAEFKTFQSDGTRTAYRGKSWYPVSPPVVSFVLDSSDHYFAQGITFGLNTSDLIPGSTLTNTFTSFVQLEDGLHLKTMSEAALTGLKKAARTMLPKKTSPVVRCEALFGSF